MDFRVADGLNFTVGRMTDSIAITINEQKYKSEFMIFDKSNHEMILGMPFLMHFNPGIDWHARTLTWKASTNNVELDEHRFEANSIEIVMSEPAKEPTIETTNKTVSEPIVEVASETVDEPVNGIANATNSIKRNECECLRVPLNGNRMR